jgi:hypothetical protein
MMVVVDSDRVGSLGSTPEYCGVDGIEEKKREREKREGGRRKDSFMLLPALVPVCHSGEAEARRASLWFISVCQHRRPCSCH